MASSVNAVSNTNTSSASGASSSNPNSPSSLASEDTFLQLFVAQLQNQDPLNPNEEDPTQMVSELAQFSQLEQLVNIGQNVSTITQDMSGSTTSSTESPTSSSQTNSSNQVNGGQSA